VGYASRDAAGVDDGVHCYGEVAAALQCGERADVLAGPVRHMINRLSDTL
jgi:hypothetical protein